MYSTAKKIQHKKLLPIVSAHAAMPLAFADLGEWLGDMSYLATETVVITLLASTVLLLLGVLSRLRYFRIHLEKKSQELEKSERHIRLMGDNLPNVTIFQLVCKPDRTFAFTFLSKGYERTLGFDRDQTLENARIAFDHVYEEDVPLLQNVFRRGLKNLQPADLGVRVLDVAGELKWLHISAVPHMADDALIWDGIMQDVSVTRHIEEALMQENKNFQNLFKTIDDFLLVCDMNGKLIHANPAVEKRMGHSAEQLADMSIFELYAETSRAEMYQVIARIQSEKSAVCDLPLQSGKGHSIPVEMNIFQGAWKNEKAIFCVARDIAIREQTETALRESQQMLQLIVDNIPMAVFWKDRDSIYMGCNTTFLHDNDLDEAESIAGKTAYDLYDEDYADEIIAVDQEVMHTNQPKFNMVKAVNLPDGAVRWKEVSKIPLRDSEGQATGVLGVWRDVTEQNQAEERLKRTLEDMERFNQLMRGRERRTLELKSEVNDLLIQLGEEEKYETTLEVQT
jgi:PAS domain S-box-containing protein